MLAEQHPDSERAGDQWEILLGKGDGSFNQPVDFQAIGSPSIFVSDFRRRRGNIAGRRSGQSAAPTVASRTW
ncbi:MAG TPA: hypothetical protein VJZ77_09585 [Blastocatellia bacterium]|nr:hypothetical protein [Blastocatellia bacterium]